LKAFALAAGAMLALAACQADRSPESRNPPQAPREASRVRDEAGLMSPRQEAELDRRIAALEKATGHQLGVATVRSLGGQSIEAYSLAFANRWALGRRGHDDGVVLLVAPTERKVRIEVGTGLENRLTDEICGAILREHVLPPIVSGDLAGGIAAGVDAIIARLEP